MQIEVDIDPNSDAQTIASEEHGRRLLADPNVPLTQIAFLRQFMHDPQPDETLEAWQAEQMYRTRIEPVVVAGELAKKFAALISVGPDGRFVGAGGVELSAEQVLAQNGALVSPPVNASVQAESAGDVPTGGPLNVNGTTPVPA